jgi:LysR family transcriptional regulator, chromosome initiation inhibitor
MSLLSPQLEAFMAVVKHKTVHAAATSLHLTQTAVTQRIKNLEAKLSTTLFIRKRTGMILTQEAETLLHYCQSTKDIEDKTLAKIKGGGEAEIIHLSISGPSSLMHSRIVPSCMPIMKKYPKLLINFQIDDIEQRHKYLKSGECDLAIIQKEDLAQEFKSKTLQTEQYVLVCSHKWKHRALKDIIKNERIIDFDPSDQLTFNYLKAHGLFEFAQHERYFVNRTQIMASLISNGFGYSLLTMEFVRPYIEDGKLIILNNGEIYHNEYVLAWYKRPETPSYFRGLLEIIC